MQETPTRPRPQPQKPKQRSSISLSKLLSTRGGTAGLAIAVAFVGAAVLMVFLTQYRASVDDESKPVTVLVAKDAIAKDTPGEIIATTGLLETTTLPQSEVMDGAVTDPGTLRGKAAAREILPGQQLAAEHFTASRDAITDKLTAYDRAIAVPVDKNHGLIGRVETGDRVDVLVGFNGSESGATRAILRTLIQDALVLEAPADDSGVAAGSGSDNPGIVLRMSDEQAAAMAYASEYGKVWVTLRGPAGARHSRVSIVTLAQLVKGLPPISLEPEAGRR